MLQMICHVHNGHINYLNLQLNYLMLHINILLEIYQIIELKKVLVLCANERDFYKKKLSQCNEWGGAEEYVSKEVPLNKLLSVVGIDKKLN